MINPGSLVDCANTAKAEEVIDRPLKTSRGWMFGGHRRIGAVFGSDGHDAEIIPIHGGQVHAIMLAP